jgi:hypothetical protein
MFTGTLQDRYSVHGHVNSILCTGEILASRTGAPIGYITLQFGGGGSGVSYFAASVA